MNTLGKNSTLSGTIEITDKTILSSKNKGRICRKENSQQFLSECEVADIKRNKHSFNTACNNSFNNLKRL